MDFEVYCDENHPELFTSKNPTADYLMIGSLWLPADLREDVKSKIWQLRRQHGIWGEIKWRKVGNRSLAFYKALVDLFESYGEQVRFRCIAVDHRQFDGNWCLGDKELGFYKFYYQVLHHWILDFNRYRIFCDVKTNRDLSRLHVLRDCLKNANITAEVTGVQALPSQQVALIQLADLLLGMASARLNCTLHADSPKAQLVAHLESKLNRQISPTHRGENKFNVFKINLKGGW
ncbi:MAG: DUF3800 domain-containing protein [Gammaproteobacteria bacterium]|nr:DUF3800 domain-containing protein [Gammaproteobacteria bacterium]MBU1831251.1 DUF3800 domain-containing protein [Gammaproteobacteria bacterium]